jgi:outer membrane protein
MFVKLYIFSYLKQKNKINKMSKENPFKKLTKVNFNKILPVVSIIAIFLSLLAIYFSKSSSELVYVDVNKLMEGYKRAKVEKEAFEQKATTMKGNIDSLITGWQKELQAYEKERASMTPKELELKQELLSNKQQQINGYQEAIQKQIQEEDKKVTQTVINDINDYVKEYGKNKGYKIIFGASGGGSIMYAAESSDLTEKVLKGLNAEYDNKK